VTAFAPTPGPGPKPQGPTHPTPTGPPPTPHWVAALQNAVRVIESLVLPTSHRTRTDYPEMPVPLPQPPTRLSQRCPDERHHGSHPVPPRGTWTPFTCAGRPTAVEQERELDATFGPLEPQTSP
jgi:hypothetical protein